MALSVADLFAACDLKPEGPIHFGYPISHWGAGVYVVALTEDPHERCGYPRWPGDLNHVQAWLNRRPELRMGGRRPTPEALARRLAQFWLPDEVVLYVDRAWGGLDYAVYTLSRCGEGEYGPHHDPAGANWLAVLGTQVDLWVHYAPSDVAEAAWARMLERFGKYASPPAHPSRGGAGRVLPYANSAGVDGVAKPHGLTGMVDPPHGR